MKKYAFVFLLVVLQSLAFATIHWIPNPTKPPKGEVMSYSEAMDTYTSYPNPEYDDYSVWKASSTVFLTEELAIAIVNHDAERMFYTEEERNAALERHLSLIENRWLFSIFLESDKYPKENFIQIGTADSEIIRVLMINDEGNRVMPIYNDSTTPERKSNLNYHSLNTIIFPKYSSENGEPIIHEDTKWIQIWVFTATERICFQYYLW